MIAEGRYSHSGTYNANTIACAAVSATMDVLAEPGLFERQRALGQTLMSGLRTLVGQAGLPVIVEGWAHRVPALVQRAGRSGTGGTPALRRARTCSPGGGRRCCSAGSCSTPASTRRNLFLLSLVHTPDDVAETLAAAEESFAVVARERSSKLGVSALTYCLLPDGPMLP